MVIAVTLMGNKTSANHLARMMHKFFTVSPKPSALTALRDPQAGAPARLIRTAFSTPRYKNLCIIRTSIASEVLTE